MVVVISTVTTLLGHITVPVTVAGDWILMNILAMVKQLFRFLVLRMPVSIFTDTNECQENILLTDMYKQPWQLCLYLLHRIQF